MLFESERHAALEQREWNEERARTTIAEIVADTEASFRVDAFWPGHPLETTPNLANVYRGAAGVMWALRHLADTGAVQLQREYSGPAAQVHGTHKSFLANPTYIVGESGVLLVEFLLARSTSTLERLYAALEASLELPADLCVGQAGSMVATNFVYRRTDDGRWRALLLRHLDRLWSGWEYSNDGSCWLWRMRPTDGTASTHLGACHGVAGNAMALMKAADLMSSMDRNELYRRCAEVYATTAAVEDGMANWLRSVGHPGWGENALLVQWCYGAPGMITAMRDFPPGAYPGMEALLLQAGELIWRAGPPSKGPGLCHGTSGNGYALLTLYERTGERRWLERSQLFAMNAIEQYHAMKTEYGRGRFSLWTGDLGLALYLWQCVQGQAGMPTLDYV